MTAPQQFSPDGQWWWDGTQWVPAAHAPVPRQVTTDAGSAPAAYGQPYGQPYGYPTPAYGMPPQSTGSDGKAIGSLILSIVWIFGVGSIAAVVLGHLSRSQARRQGRPPSGLALAGLIIGYIGITGAVLTGLFAFAFKDQIVDTVRLNFELESAAQAEQSYHDTHGTYTGSLEELRAYGYDDQDGKVDIRVISATDTSFCFSGSVAFNEVSYVSDEDPRSSNTPCS